MSPLPTQDVSLYQLILDAEPAPQTLSVSPATLKSLVQGLIEVLIEQKITSELWVKVPPGKVWDAEIEAHDKRVGTHNTVYVCKTLKSKEGNKEQAEIAPLSRIIPINLVSVAHRRREYFLLFLSDQFCGLILAHRSRSAQQMVQATSNRHQLLMTCTFNQQTVQRVYQEIRRGVCEDLDRGKRGAQVGAPQPLATSSSAASTLLTQMLAKQLNYQENIWQKAESDRILAAESAALKQEKQELLDALQLKDEFLMHVGQELRTPLTNMKTAMTLIETTNLKAPQRQLYMRLLRTECDRQSSLISRLLEMVQLEHSGGKTDKQPVHLADVIPGVVSTYQAIAQEKGVQLGYTVSNTLPTVSCLEAWIRQITINLLQNSIKFTPPGGQVLVRTKQQGEYVQIEIRDTGIGIAPQELPRIFDRFYRGRAVLGEESGGAGLGLTIVQQILLRCGGSISVTSRLGEGSTFKVLLPIEPSTPK